MTLLGILDLYRAGRIKFSDRTFAEYVGTLRQFDAFLGRPSVPDDLTDANLLAFLKFRYETRSAATARKDRQQLLAIWRWCYKKHHTELLPRDIPDIQVPRRRVRAWHPHEVDAILRAAKSAPLDRDWGSLEWRALILTMYDSGERIQALLQCPASGFNQRQQSLAIPASARKYGQADHTASLHESTCKEIRRMLRQRRTKSDRLFAWWGCYHSLLRRFHRLLESAGVDPDGRKPFHDFRRSSYTAVFAAIGRDAAREHCGHSADLSKHYLDQGLLDELSPDKRTADRIWRPTS